MKFYLPNKKHILLSLICLLLSSWMGWAGASAPPDYKPRLTIQYFDSQLSKRITIENCTPGETYNIPSGSIINLIISVENLSENPSRDPASIDIWHDWPYRRTPEVYVDPDAVCAPQNPGDCQKILEKMRVDYAYLGRQGKGTYHIVIWVDRFDTQTESDEGNNYLGPIKIKALPTRKLSEPLDIYPIKPKLIENK